MLFRSKELQDALVEAKRQGAFSFWNHPGWRGKAQWWPPIATAFSDKLFQGIELVNGKSYYDEAHPWVGQHNLVILGTSDIHMPSLSAEERSLSLLLVKERTLAGVREALDSGRTVAWQQKRLVGTEKVLGDLVRAYVQPATHVRASKTRRTAALALRNDSALHFDLKTIEAPAWMEIGSVTLPPHSTTLISLRRSPETPAVRQRVALRFEVSNAIAGPGQQVTLPIEFEYRPE